MARLPRSRTILFAGVAVAAAVALAMPAAAFGARGAAPKVELGRQTLPANDGWAAQGTGTTGGAAADAAHVFTVRSRSALVAALATGAAPKIIYVKNSIKGNVDANDKAVGCDYYADPAYTLEGYLAAYDPATWGTADPSGPLEEARARSATAQGKNIKLKVPANTTIVGLGASAKIEGLNLDVRAVDNVIIRNVQFIDAHDCFPQWDPTDGATGNWNSEYDNISVYNSTHVWVDHNTFTDGQNQDKRQPFYFGRPWQVHDGQLDITNGSDWVTYSWNVFTDHDKTNLLGSTNNPSQDLDKLHITVHHNLYRNVIQRLPRVRFGQVHVYNNVYQIPRKTAVNGESAFEYALGVGFQSAIYAEKNVFELGPTVPAGSLLWNWGGTALTAKDNVVNGKPTDIIAEYNATHDPDFGTDAGWTPSLVGRVDPTAGLSPLVRGHAGVGRVC